VNAEKLPLWVTIAPRIFGVCIIIVGLRVMGVFGNGIPKVAFLALLVVGWLALELAAWARRRRKNV